ncbi:MAG: hypothetical protein QOI87_3811, partial [Bradyrhizobium sp.]|nr:hypothetical protein [Bradyrhizobium sp.]
ICNRLPISDSMGSGQNGDDSGNDCLIGSLIVPN